MRSPCGHFGHMRIIDRTVCLEATDSSTDFRSFSRQQICQIICRIIIYRIIISRIIIRLKSSSVSNPLLSNHHPSNHQLSNIHSSTNCAVADSFNHRLSVVTSVFCILFNPTISRKFLLFCHWQNVNNSIIYVFCSVTATSIIIYCVEYCLTLPRPRGGGKITPQSIFLPITQTTRPTTKIPSVTFPEYVFCTEWW